MATAVPDEGSATKDLKWNEDGQGNTLEYGPEAVENMRFRHSARRTPRTPDVQLDRVLAHGRGDHGGIVLRPAPALEPETRTEHTVSRLADFEETPVMKTESASLNNDSAVPLNPSDEPKPNLIVNYLPQGLNDSDFYNIFAPYGPLASINIMREMQSGYSYGYGFVNFVDLSDAMEAKEELNGLQLGNKQIKVSFARPPSDDLKNTNVFVTGLSQNMTDERLLEMFSPFGTIFHSNLLRSRGNGNLTGAAFIRYETSGAAKLAIETLNGYKFPQTRESIRVRLAIDHGKQKAAYVAGYCNAARQGKEGVLVIPKAVYGPGGIIKTNLNPVKVPEAVEEFRKPTKPTKPNSDIKVTAMFGGNNFPRPEAYYPKKERNRPRISSANERYTSRDDTLWNRGNRPNADSADSDNWRSRDTDTNGSFSFR